MLLCILLHLLQMLVITILSQPGDHILVRPVDLERVRMLIVDMILDWNQLLCQLPHKTYVNRHLVNMYTFLDAELRDQNIKCRIQDAYDFGLTDNGAITLSQIRYENTEIEMSRLFLSKYRRISFAAKQFATGGKV